MNEEWKAAVLHLASLMDVAETRDEEIEFCDTVELISSIEGDLSLDTVQFLLQFVSNQSGYAAIEAITGLLTDPSTDVVLNGVFDDLSRLLDVAPDWAEQFLAQIIASDPESVVLVAQQSPDHIKDCLRELLLPGGLLCDYQHADDVFARLFGDEAQ